MLSVDALNDKNFLPRTLAVFIFGFIFAGFLTWFMYVLIQSGEKSLDESVRVQILDFVRMKRTEVTEKKQRKPERPSVTEAPPTPEAAKNDNSNKDLDNSISIADLSAQGVSMELDGVSLGSGDGEYLPIVKVAPIYPYSARTRGIEGACVVQYTVTAKGTTRDVKVMEEYCENRIFRKSSIEAAKKFRYKPRVINNETVEVHDVKNQFIYTLDDE